ncbi:MAG TPA: ABC transporter ATP-binding protein [Mycobacteriales bacterium]|jgi:branched-chain amino acid transport system ATP-binding protein|nr:ABC transporter ATP-binding protein [Mycobacteriales bacterium]
MAGSEAVAGSTTQAGRSEQGGGSGRFEVQDVTVRFGGLVALDAVSLHVEPREVLGVIGPNGAGKTTLFNVCCGFQTPSNGALRWDGTELRGLKPHRLASLGIARTLQGVGLFEGLTVLENVATGAHSRSRSGFLASALGLPSADRDEDARKAEAYEALTALDAAGYADRYPGSLPYPVQKRVALARALVAKPRLLLLDEPAAGLSSDEMDELGDLIQRLADEMAVMLVEHHMDLVMRVCDRITVLDFGKVIANGTPDEVRNDEAVLAAYLGEDVEGHLPHPGLQGSGATPSTPGKRS